MNQKEPDRLIRPDGKPRLGDFTSHEMELNLGDATIKHPLSFLSHIPLLGGLERGFRSLRHKEWEHWAIVHDRFYFGFAVVNVHYLSNAFAYLFDRADESLIEYSIDAPGPGASTVPAQLWDNRGGFQWKGNTITIENCIRDGRHRIEIDLQATRKSPALSAEIEIRQDVNEVTPLMTTVPLGGDRFLYTHKSPCLPATGWIEAGETRLDLNGGLGIIDYHQAYYPYRSFWRWATFAGRDGSGRTIGGNFTQNTAPEPWNENGIWIDGHLERLSPARFTFDESNVLKPWRISTDDGRVDLEFKPAGERSANFNLGLIRSMFHQPFGTFQGTIRDSLDTKIKVDNLFGVTEHHVSWW